MDMVMPKTFFVIYGLVCDVFCAAVNHYYSMSMKTKIKRTRVEYVQGSHYRVFDRRMWDSLLQPLEGPMAILKGHG